MSTTDVASGSGVRVTVFPKAGSSTEAAQALRTYGDVEAQGRNRITGTVPEPALTDLANASSIRFVQQPAPATTLDTGGEDEINVTKLHSLNDSDFSGDGATIAVIDTDDFESDNANYSDQVISRRNTDDGGPSSHGTKTAEIVAQTAPEANLILSKVNSYAGLQTEIKYLRQNTTADVISISVGFINAGPLDGTSAVDSDVRQFVNSGGIFIAAAGNNADGNNWHGTYRDPDGNGVANITDSREHIDIGNPPSIAYTISLQWDDWDAGGSDEDYDLQVVNGNTGNVIRESSNLQDGQSAPPVERTFVQASDENPQLRIVHNSGAEDAELTLRSFSNVNFQPSTAATSTLVPATSDAAIAVGAYGDAIDEESSLQPYSSRGPTVDGRIKPDIVGPDGVIAGGEVSWGTSFAAPHVAGVAGAAVAENGSLTPSEFESEMQTTATSIQSDEPNNRVGYGLVDGAGILAEIEQNPPTVSAYTVTDGEDDDGRVAVGDQINFSANVSDEFLDSVTVNASTFDAGTVQLSDDDGDGVYTGTGTVGPSAAEGASTVSMTAADVAGNTNSTADSSLTVDNQITSLSVDNGPLNPGTDTLNLSGQADAVDTIAFQLRDSEGETGTVTKSISNQSFSVTVDTSSLSLSGGNDQIDSGSVTVEAEQAESFASAEASAVFDADRADPTLSLGEPATDTTVTSGTTVDVQYTANDTNDLGIRTTTIELIDADGNTLVSRTDSDVADGTQETASLTLPDPSANEQYDLVVTTTDYAGNSESQTHANRITVDDSVEEATIDTGLPVQPGEQLTISGIATSTHNISIQLTDSDGDTATTSKQISTTAYSISVRPDELSYAGENGTLDDGPLTLELAQASSVTSPEATVTAAIDGTAPGITLDSPSTRIEQTSGSDQSVAFSVDDTEDYGVANATVQIVPGSSGAPLASTEIDVNDEEQATATLSLPSTAQDGTYDIEIAATDAAGNEQTVPAAGEVLIDDEVRDLTTRDSYFSDNVTINGTADSTENLTVDVVGSNGTTTTLRKSISSTDFSVAIETANLDHSTSDGPLTIRAVQGSAQNGAEATLSTTTLDTTKPTVSVSSVSAPRSPATGGDTINVSYTPTDTAGYGIDSATIEIVATDGTVGASTVDSSITGGEQQSTSLTLPAGISEGAYDIRVNATDNAGNTQSTTGAPVSVDNVVRSISQTRSSAVYNTSATITLEGTIDAPTGIEYQVSQGGSSVLVDKPVSNTDYSHQLNLSETGLSLSDGDITVAARESPVSQSSTSYSGEANLTATIDATPPVVSIDNSMPTSVTTGDNITVNYTADDATGLRNGSVRLVREDDGTTVATQSEPVTSGSQQSTTLTVPDIANGAYAVEVVAEDTAYNAGTATSSTISVANAVDTVAVDSPSAGFVSGSKNITVSGNADAATHVTFELSGPNQTATVTKQISSTTYSVEIDLGSLSSTAAGFTDGNLTINASQGETYTNAEATASVTIESATPYVSDIGVSVSDVEPGGNVEVTYTPVDPGPTSLDSATVSLVNSEGTAIASQTETSPSNQSEQSATLSIPSDAAQGSYDVVVSVRDTAGNAEYTAHRVVDALTVKSPTGSSDDDDGGSSGVNSGSVLADTLSEDEEPTTEPVNTTPEPITTTPTRQDNESIAASVATVSANQTITIDINESASDMQDVANETQNATNSASNTQPDVAWRQVNITSQTDTTNVQIRLSESDEPSNETPSNGQAAAIVGYINVEPGNITDPDRTPGSFTFEVSAAERAELGVTPSEIQMYRYNNQAWDAISTTYLGGDRFRAETPGFSWFAVGTTERSASVTDARLNTTTVRPGEPVAVTATITNSNLGGDRSVELAAAGDVITTKTVFVGENSTAEETFVFSLDTVGTYQITVEGATAGTVTVSQSAPAPDSTTETPTAGEATETQTLIGRQFPGSGGKRIFGVGALVVGVAALLVGLRRLNGD